MLFFRVSNRVFEAIIHAKKIRVNNKGSFAIVYSKKIKLECRMLPISSDLDTEYDGM